MKGQMTNRKATKIVSSDLNGTLVHQHTMSEMIRIYLSGGRYAAAKAVFELQTAGKLGEEAMSISFVIVAGPLTKGLTLRQAIEYTIPERGNQNRIKYVNGFQEFIEALHKVEIPFIINSTGYDVTTAAIRAQVGKEKIHSAISNRLVFGLKGSETDELTKEETEQKVMDYFADPTAAAVDKYYDIIQAVGRVEVGIENEAAKATLLAEYIDRNPLLSHIGLEERMHIGDTMGDGEGIRDVALAGGLGIAFNYNKPLEDYLRRAIDERPELSSRIFLVNPKGPEADLRNILPLILGD